MPIPVETLEAEVLRLPTSERTRLLDRVVASLDADQAREAAWDDLAALRQREIAAGAVSLVDGPEFVEKLRAELS